MKNMIVGLSGSQCDFGDTGFIRDYINKHYSDSIIKIGGTPIILPLTDDEETIFKYVELIDGLILTGGDDINPQLFNEECLPETQISDLERDSFDMLLIKYASQKKIPILGICRGMQLLNIYFGGSLYQDLKYNKEVCLKHLQGTRNPHIPVHKIIPVKNSFLDKLFIDDLWVNSFHHQSIKTLGKNLQISSKSSDNVIEAIEYIDEDHFILGVQWHPEMMYSQGNNKDMKKLFQYFMDKLRENK